MSQTQYSGVILAGGRGSRMIPFGDQYPKPILPVGNQPLILRNVEIFRELGIVDIVVLVGHRGFEISKILGDGSALGVRIRYVEQTDTLGIAHATGRLESSLNQPFLMFLGDIFFVPGDLREMFRLFEEQSGGAVLATKLEADPSAIQKNYSLLIEDGMVSRVIEKPRYVRNNLKGVGIYLFDLAIFDAIRRTPRTAQRDEYEITDSVQILIDDGYPVRASNAVLDDVNLTTPADLLRCNLMLAKQSPSGVCMGESVDLHPGARLTDCVVGNRVAISRPTMIRQSVIFDETRVDQDAEIHHHILTPDYTVDCSLSLRA